MRWSPWLMVVSLVSLSGFAEFQFGTKFACCVPQNVSCLGGGGATIWQRTLRDRALTQADAKLRCGFHQMQWATHSCPADTQCSNGGTTTTTRPRPTHTASVRNSLPRSGYVVVRKITYGGSPFVISSWFEVKPGETRTFTHDNTMCVGWSVNGVDRIRQERMRGSIFTTSVGTTWVHPQKGTELTYGMSNGSWFVNLSLERGLSRFQRSQIPSSQVDGVLAGQGLVNYDCLFTSAGNNVMSID